MVANQPATARERRVSGPNGELKVDSSQVYRVFFHGPAYQVIERAWWDGKRMIGLLAKDLPGNHHPPNLPTLMAPRLIELCFQTAGLWELAVQHRMALPQSVDSVRVLHTPGLAVGPLYAVVTPDAGDGSFGAEVVDGHGNQYVELRAYRTVALPDAINPELLRPLDLIMTETCDVLSV